MSATNPSRSAQPVPDDDPDGLSFFTSGQRSAASSSVFGATPTDPLDRVFGADPIVRDEAMGTVDLSATASLEQVHDDTVLRSVGRDTPAWRRAFILHGPPASPPPASPAPRSSFLTRLRPHHGDRS